MKLYALSVPFHFFCSFLHCSGDDKKLETKLDRNMGFMKWVKARHDTTYISMLYSIQQYFVKQEMYEDAARLKKVIDEELKEIERFMKDKDYS